MRAQTWLSELKDDWHIASKRGHWTLICKTCGQEETLRKNYEYRTLRLLKQLWIHGWRCGCEKREREMDAEYQRELAEDRALRARDVADKLN